MTTLADGYAADSMMKGQEDEEVWRNEDKIKYIIKEIACFFAGDYKKNVLKWIWKKSVCLSHWKICLSSLEAGVCGRGPRSMGMDTTGRVWPWSSQDASVDTPAWSSDGMCAAT